MDDDIGDMTKKLEQADGGNRTANIDPKVMTQAIAAVLSPRSRPAAGIEHVSPTTFRRGQPVTIEARAARSVDVMRLHYRHVNQTERWRTADMEVRAGRWRATIPGAYTDTVFPLQYYLELRNRSGGAWMHPGLGADLMSQPYVVLEQNKGRV
jgi:hypothetical protein